MLGTILLLLILGLIVAVVAQKQLAVPCQLQPRWWRVTPPGVTPVREGKANSLFAVLRLAKQVGGKSFNYSYKTGYYQIFSQWLVNWTQPIDIVSAANEVTGASFTYTPAVSHVTGTLANGVDVVPPAPCCEKIKCEMAAHGLHPNGENLRDFANAGVPGQDTNYYNVKAAAATWSANDGVKSPPSALTATQPDAATMAAKRPYIDTATMTQVQTTGQAIGAFDANGNPTTVPKPAPCTDTQCDFCQSYDASGTCQNSTAKFWFGCNARGQLYTDATKTTTYALSPLI